MDKERVLEIWGPPDTPLTKRQILAFASALEAALLEGKCLVPVEPTHAMKVKGGYAIEEQDTYLSMYDAELVYRAMLQAAPKGGE